MADALLVVMGERPGGTLTRLAGGRLRFDYDDEYRRGPEATPLSLSMPTPVASHADAVVTPWLWGLLPDNDAVLSRWARTFRVSASSPFALLATPVGEDCAGAVRFVTAEGADGLPAPREEVAWLTEDDVASRLRDLRLDSTAWLGRAATGQFSLAGAQAKTALLFRDGRWGLPTGGAATTHILKPAIVGLDDHDLNEHLCLDAAGRAGLPVARSRVARFGEESAIVVERYDRLVSDGRLIRVHQEDLCQALGVHPARKYQADGGPGPGDIAGLFRRVMPARVADDAIWRFADALAWNWLIAGTDAHAKNYSVLLSGHDARLAPLYDIASALPYGEHEASLRFAMKIGGDYRVASHRNTWPAAAADLGVDPERLIERVRVMADRAPAAFAEAAAESDVASLESVMPRRLSDLVAQRAGRCRRLLG